MHLEFIFVYGEIWGSSFIFLHVDSQSSLVSSRLISFFLVSKVSGIFINEVLQPSYGGQPRAMAVPCVV